MAQLDKDDLAQMNRDYFQSLEKERLVEVALNLHYCCRRAMGKTPTELKKQLLSTIFGQSIQQSGFL